MQVIKRKISVPKEVVVYTAEDGTEFDSKWRCLEYEKQLAMEEAKEIIDRRPKELDGCPPFDGGDYREEHSYKWFFIDTEETANILDRAFKTETYTAIGDKFVNHIGQWVCVEVGFDGDVWLSPLPNSTEYARFVLGKLGYSEIFAKTVLGQK